MAKRKQPEIQEPLSQAKKQRLEDESSILTDSSTSHGDAQDLLLKRAVSSPKAKGPKDLRGKRTPRRKATIEVAEPALKAIPISTIVRAKVLEVLDFNSKSLPSALDRDEENRDHATIGESTAIAALMRMRCDYEMSDPTLASLDDLSEILLQSFEKRIGDNPWVRHVVLDLSKQSQFEAAVHLKVNGHGLESIGLLEVELEHLTRDLETAAANDIFRHMQTVYDESDSNAEASLGDEDPTKGNEREKMELFDEAKEVKRNGVCPAPLMEL